MKSNVTPNMTDYDAAVRDFKLDVPERFNYTVDVFEGHVRRAPDKIALMIGSADGAGVAHFTFAQLSAKVNQFCNVARRLGLKKGDRVMLLMGWAVEWYAAMLGMIKLGIVPVPTTTQSRPRDLLYRFDLAGVVAVICSDSLHAAVDEIAAQAPTLRHRLLATDTAQARPGWVNLRQAMAAESTEFAGWESTLSGEGMLIYFTSGTVAYPKMVLHTQASYGIGHTLTARFWHDLHAEDIHWTITDTGWGKAVWGCLFGQWTVGATVFISAAARFEPQKALATIAKIGITTFCAAPTVYRIFVREDLSQYDLSSLRHCTSAGEPLNPEVIRLWRQATGTTIYDGYGQTETVNVLANFRCLPVKHGSMGKPVPGFDVRVLDEQGNEMPAGKEGLVALRVKPQRPVGLFSHYVNNDEAMAASFRGDFYYTGDRAVRDADGYFWFVSRADDVIITSGYRIGPFEVESALLEHPAVKESAVVSSPDVMRGEIVKAFVVLAAGHKPSSSLILELQQHVRSVTAPYKYPRAIEFVTELPKTVSGKIRRGELRRREWAGWKGGGMRKMRRRRFGRTYRRLGLLGMLEKLRRSLLGRQHKPRGSRG